MFGVLPQRSFGKTPDLRADITVGNRIERRPIDRRDSAILNADVQTAGIRAVERADGRDCVLRGERAGIHDYSIPNFQLPNRICRDRLGSWELGAGSLLIVAHV